MKKILLLILVTSTLCGCQSGCFELFSEEHQPAEYCANQMKGHVMFLLTHLKGDHNIILLKKEMAVQKIVLEAW